MSECLLSIDTSTPAGSIAVSRGDQLLGELLVNSPATHTDRLLLSMERLLQDVAIDLGEIDAFAVAVGPGSFTGLRVGVATAKGLALATGKPVIGVSSLQSLAAQIPFCRYPVCAMMDARKKEVYGGLYRWEGGLPALQGREVVLPPEKMLEQLDGEVLFVGNGSAVYRTMIVRRLGQRAHFAPWCLDLPRASTLSTLALSAYRNGRTLSALELLPTYIRPSEAELTLTRA
ncbi:MAG: tRNA (adenosine(37)-N6)-threonylcarbamoyltransferase complex dimerization subunit type 1 TsaB [Syntrophotaleaceae bacterium]